MHCCCQCAFGWCFNTCNCTTMFDDEETKVQEAAAPGSTAVFHRDLKRASRNGRNTYGIVHNAVGSLISKDWGFDAREIPAQKMKVMVSYNHNDTQCGSKELLPRNPHGQWLAEHFTKHAAVCQVNVGGKDGADGAKVPNQHGAQQFKIANGEFVTQLLAL